MYSKQVGKVRKYNLVYLDRVSKQFDVVKSFLKFKTKYSSRI